MLFKNFKYITKHKFYVFIECCKLGIPIRGILHDWHKFLPSEFFPYARYFFNNKNNNVISEHEFDVAWLKHQHRGKHHWQYWLLKNDDGTLTAMNMPDKYKKEMLSDWIGAGKAINGKNDVKDWYYNNRHKMVLHAATKYWIEKQLESY